LQLKAETIVDRESIDRGQFKAQGGFARLNKVFEGKLEQVSGRFMKSFGRTLHEGGRSVVGLDLNARTQRDAESQSCF